MSVGIIISLEPAGFLVVVVEVVIWASQALLVSEQFVFIDQCHLVLEDVRGNVVYEEADRVDIAFKAP